MKRDLWLPWLVIGVAVGGSLIAGGILLRKIAREVRAAAPHAPLTQSSRGLGADVWKRAGGGVTAVEREGDSWE